MSAGLCLLMASTLFGCGGPELGRAEIGTRFNHPPSIESIVPDPTRIDEGQSTSLQVQLEDPDGDALVFEWSADCDGSFDDAGLMEPTFALNRLTGTYCTLDLLVTDELGSSVHGSVTINTGPPANGG